MAIPRGTHPHCYIMKTAWKAFPHFHQLAYRKIDAQLDRTKVKVMSDIGEYLRKSKCTSKSICEYLYGINGSQKAVPKREHMFEPGDILDIFKFFRVIEVNRKEDVCKTAPLAITSRGAEISCLSNYSLKQLNKLYYVLLLFLFYRVFLPNLTLQIPSHSFVNVTFFSSTNK